MGNRFTRVIKLFFLLFITSFFSLSFQPINDPQYEEIRHYVKRGNATDVYFDFADLNYSDVSIQSILSRVYIFKALKIIDALYKFITANSDEDKLGFVGRFIKKKILGVFFNKYGNTAHILTFYNENSEMIKKVLNNDRSEKGRVFFGIPTSFDEKEKITFTFKIYSRRKIFSEVKHDVIEIAAFIREIYDSNFTHEFSFDVLIGIINYFAEGDRWSIADNFDIYSSFLKMGIIDNIISRS